MPIDDITKTGRQTWKDLQKQNNPDNTGYTANDAKAFRMTLNQLQAPVEPVPFEQLGDFGHSRYDRGKEGVPMWALDNLEDYRAHRQSSLNKMGAGIGKGVALAATTFIDGTLGLLTGAVEGIGALASGAGGYEAVSKLWDNSVSNALKQVNDEMEKILPNYRTKAEQEREWWQNLGTANFWADTFIKNLGFTVGAFYSGQAWNTALKAAGVLKSAASAQVVGSVMSAVNEGRIEANNNSKDFLTAQREQLKLGYDKALADIDNDPALNDYEKAVRISDLDKTYAQLDQKAQHEADRMGLAVLIGNTAILSASNLWQFGKLYSRGFDNAKGIMGRIQSGIEREGIKGGVKEGGKYVAETMTKGQMVRRALTNPLAEGFEEMNQAFIAEHAGLFRSSDNPDAYYKALTDPEYEYKTRDWFSSFTEGLANTYGSGDRWQEFAVGWLTGAIGMPTVGRVNNADANTYLGRGKAVGISGGFLGELRSLNAQNIKRQSTADAMNKFVDNMNQQIGHMAQSNYFTDAMDGWAADQNQFEWTNARDNEMFTGFSAFRKAGRLNDFKEIINQDFENLTDEKLQEIAINTTPAVELNDDGTAKRTDASGKVLTAGWRDKKTGQLLSETPEGREQMRQELTEKRNRIQDALDSYEKALETVRGIGNNFLTDDEENEMAWLKWKMSIFDKRFGELKQGNEPFIRTLDDAIDKFIYRQSGQLLEDKQNERTAEGKRKLGGKAKAKYAPVNIANGEQVMSYMQSVKNYLDMLQQANSPSMAAALLEYTPEITEVLKAFKPEFLKEYMSIDTDAFNESINQLSDMAKISSSYKQFSETYDKFTKDPLKLKENRNKIDSENQKTQEAVNKVKQEEALKNMSVSEINEQIDNGTLNPDDINLGSLDEGIVANFEEAEAVRNTKDGLIRKVESSDADDVTKKVALDMLSKYNPDSVDQLIDLESGIYNDPTAIDIPQEVINAVEGEEKKADLIDNVMANAKSLLSQAIDTLENENAEIPDTSSINALEGFEIEDTTGRDGTTKTITVNEERKEQYEKQQKESKDVTNPMNRISVVNKMMLYIDKHVSAPLETTQRDALEQALFSVVGQFNRLYKDGNSSESILKAISSTRGYQIADSIFPIKPLLENYFKGIGDYIDEQEETFEPADSTEEQQDTTPNVSEEDVVNEVALESTRKEYESKSPKPYNFWRTTSTQLPINKKAYDNTEFWKQAESLGYKGEQLQRIKAIGEFFEKNRVFDRVNQGEVQAGDKIGFSIVKDLNDKAGSIVILITDSKGNIIGDMPAMTDATVDDYIGLRDFLQSILDEYEKADSPDTFTSTKTSIVNKTMIGKVPYSRNRNNLNKVFGDVPFKLGIAMNAGKTAVIGTPGITKYDNDPIRNVTLPALKAKAGQPYLLMPTSDKTGISQYIPVPFLMDRYNPRMQGTTFDKIITDLVTKLYTANNKNVMSVIKDFKEFFAIPEFHVNYLDNEIINVSIRTADMQDRITIYNRAGDDLNAFVNSIKQSLYKLQLPIQVSRKYINSFYGDTDYNRMLGELATVNLDEGSTHTISDWFTIKMVDANGKVVDTKSPKSIGINPTTKSVETKPVANNQNPTIVLTRNGLLGTTANQQTWESLTPEQQQFIASKSKPKQSQLMQQLVAAKAMGNSVDEILGTRYSVADGRKESFDLNKELAWLDKVLPQFSIDENKQLIAGLQHAGLDLYGMFKEGLIYLNSTNQTRGTTYHEAFHAVFLTLLTDKERAEVIKEAEKKFGNLEGLELEEKLAEDFRQYVEYEEYSGSWFKKIWRKLKRMIQHLRGKDSVLNALYYDINHGNYKKFTPTTSNEIRYNNKELEDIKSKAIVGGTFMKAPNGKDTNLTERQWLQVRTKAFKDWFGDWENDAVNASKVVDENGEPLVVYHGGSLTNVFDTKGQRKTRGAGIKKGDIGAYFTSNRGSALNYEEIHRYKNSDGVFDIIESLKEAGVSDEEIDKVWDTELLGLRSGTRDFFLNIRNPKKTYYKGTYKNGFSKEDTNVGNNDGQIIKRSDTNEVEYVAFNPNQIKSATDNNGEFSKTNDDIRYREIPKMSKDEESRLNDYRYIRSIITNMTNDAFNVREKYIEYRDVMKDESAAERLLEKAVKKAWEQLHPKEKVDVNVKVVDNNNATGIIKSFTINGINYMDEYLRLLELENNISEIKEIQRLERQYINSRTKEQLISEQALIDQGDTFRYRVAVENYYNNYNEQSESIQKEWSDIGGVPEEFSNENYETKKHCNY